MVNKNNGSRSTAFTQRANYIVMRAREERDGETGAAMGGPVARAAFEFHSHHCSAYAPNARNSLLVSSSFILTRDVWSFVQ
ncbi:hypothetical protein EVAR_41256_1 [Eumeta japonica]|uniref:Uncharacterized protein n=1 Tax=Eumeta variegata TaxID=151549 RepID=A0A4C1W704_EUMVA|nr:hypothetical protein EVAR_41256_1 [Eumeta japonica]